MDKKKEVKKKKKNPLDEILDELHDYAQDTQPEDLMSSGE